MIPLIEDHRDAIITLCQQYGAWKLALFGSAAGEDFDVDTSDVDFVLEFLDYGQGVATRFIDFADDLEALLRGDVDLLFESMVKDPDLIREVGTSTLSELPRPSGAMGRPAELTEREAVASLALCLLQSHPWVNRAEGSLMQPEILALPGTRFPWATIE
jgi:predicted nucleotidyltransferase